MSTTVTTAPAAAHGTAKLPVPRTLEELRAAAKTLTAGGRYGLGLPAQAGGGAVDAYLGLLWAFGGEALRGGKPALRTEEATQALQERIAARLGYRLIGHRLELLGVPAKKG